MQTALSCPKARPHAAGRSAQRPRLRAAPCAQCRISCRVQTQQMAAQHLRRRSAPHTSPRHSMLLTTNHTDILRAVVLRLLQLKPLWELCCCTACVACLSGSCRGSRCTATTAESPKKSLYDDSVGCLAWQEECPSASRQRHSQREQCGQQRRRGQQQRQRVRRG